MRSRERERGVVSCLGVIDQVVLSSPLGKIETPNAKKRHRRAQTTNASNAVNSALSTPKSSSNANGGGGDDDGDEIIFIIVSLDKQWYFEAQSNEERDEWVQAIEQQILFSLQNIESSKAARAAKIGGPSMADPALVQTIKQVTGNGFCADCEQISRITIVSFSSPAFVVSSQIRRGPPLTWEH